jgi:hypothetical protein
VTGVAFLVFSMLFFMGAVVVIYGSNPAKAQRYAVTLKQNEGAFVGLRVEKHWKHWTFEDIKLPQQPGAHVAEVAPGRLHVPVRNILYYQELANVVE